MRDDMKEQNAALLVARESREFASSVAEQVEEHVGEVNCEDFMEMKLDNAEQEDIDAAIDDDTVAVVLDSTDKGDGMTQDVLVPKAWIPEPGEGEMPKLWIPDPEAHPDHKATKNDFPTMMEEVDVAGVPGVPVGGVLDVFSSIGGWGVLAAVIVMEFVGVLLIRRIVAIDI